MRLAFGALFSAFLAAWGAEAQPLTFLSQAARQQSVEFDVFLPLRNVDQLDELIRAQHTKGSASYHEWLTPAEFRARFGPNPHAVERISARLRAAGLTVTGTHSHGIRVRGSVDEVQSALGVILWNAKTRHGNARLAARGPLALPRDFVEAGAHIAAFSPAV